jgi:hypothetical protein
MHASQVSTCLEKREAQLFAKFIWFNQTNQINQKTTNDADWERTAAGKAEASE